MSAENSVTCPKCGAILPPVGPAEGRIPCPSCGFLPALAIHADETIGLSGHVMAAGVRDGQPIGFTESELQHLTRYAALQEDGTILLNLSGIPPRGEDESEDVVRILLDRFHSKGEIWKLGGRGIGDDDLLVTRISPPSIHLSVQVVRALTFKAFWENLARKNRISGMKLSIPDASSALRASIEHKGQIPPGHRSQMILALDAYRLPALALGAVADHFRRAEGSWAATLGFYAIYVVGPTEIFVHRLDE